MRCRAFAGRADRLRDARSRQRARDRHVDLAVLRPEDLVRRRPRRRVDAGRGGRAARGRRGGARADLGDRRRRGRLAVRRRRPRRAVREPRRRADLGAQPRAAPSTGSTRTGSRAVAGCACTRSCPGPASPTSSRSRSPPPACGSPRITADTGGRGNRGILPALPARRGAARTTFRCASTGWSAPSAIPSACSSSSTAACTAPTTPARTGATIGDGPALGLRLPARARPERSRQRLRDPAHRRLRPRHARRPRARVRDARRRRRGRRAATGCPPRRPT